MQIEVHNIRYLFLRSMLPLIHVIVCNWFSDIEGYVGISNCLILELKIVGY